MHRTLTDKEAAELLRSTTSTSEEQKQDLFWDAVDTAIKRLKSDNRKEDDTMMQMDHMIITEARDDGKRVEATMPKDIRCFGRLYVPLDAVLDIIDEVDNENRDEHGNTVRADYSNAYQIVWERISALDAEGGDEIERR